MLRKPSGSLWSEAFESKSTEPAGTRSGKQQRASEAGGLTRGGGRIGRSEGEGKQNEQTYQGPHLSPCRLRCLYSTWAGGCCSSRARLLSLRYLLLRRHSSSSAFPIFQVEPLRKRMLGFGMDVRRRSGVQRPVCKGKEQQRVGGV